MTSEEFQQITDESVAFEERHGAIDLVGPASAFRSLGPPELRIKDQGVFIDGTNLVVSIEDGRVISVPLSWFPKLDNATPEQRFGWRLIAGGRGICWDELDEDLSLRGLLSEKAQPLPRP